MTEVEQLSPLVTTRENPVAMFNFMQGICADTCLYLIDKSDFITVPVTENMMMYN